MSGARRECYTESVAISAKMLAVLQKVEAARDQLFAELRAGAKRDAEVKAQARIRAKARPRKPTNKPDS